MIYALGTKEREELKAKYYIIDTKISSIDIKNKAAENLKENVLKVIETFKEASEEDEEIKFSYEL